MMLTHAQLLDAVRAAGRDRESFTCADVRQQLGLATQDRQQLNRFYSRFRALQKDATTPIEKLGSNCYRLRATATEAPAAAPSLDVALTQDDEPSVPALEQADEMVTRNEMVTRDLAAPSSAADVAECSLEAAALAPSSVEPGEVISAQARNDVEPFCAQDSQAGERETTAQPPVAHVPKPRGEWLNRMARFFGRRPSKSDATHEIAVGV